MPNFAVLVLLLSNLAYVAAEKTDGFWGDNLQIWDMAAGILMVREAGGFVTDKESGSDIFRKKKYHHNKTPQEATTTSEANILPYFS
ncbi:MULTISPECIES: inositol monophosphatase family protein [unclassified Bartonella]|uniref:inositol monophosphatase family protein n=1 Tax=unclassified Bartonella TaxID=2645622 RepID=UPI0035CFCD8A